MTSAQTELEALLARIADLSHIPVEVLAEDLDVLGRRALNEPRPSLALSRYMLEQQPRLKGCTEQVWRAADLWVAAARR
ncbi:MAG TPA: hypothetical protein VIM86_12745 [Thermodesulfobacteriota bacterium]